MLEALEGSFPLSFHCVDTDGGSNQRVAVLSHCSMPCLLILSIKGASLKGNRAPTPARRIRNCRSGWDELAQPAARRPPVRGPGWL